MIVCIVFPDKARYLQQERPAQKTSSEAPVLFMFFSVQNLAIIRKLMFFQAVVRGSFINKIPQIGENQTQASVCVFGGNDLFRETIIFKFV